MLCRRLGAGGLEALRKELPACGVGVQPTLGVPAASYLGVRYEIPKQESIRMTMKKKLAAFLLASMAMLGVSGCYHHHHYDDHHPPPPHMDHDR